MSLDIDRLRKILGESPADECAEALIDFIDGAAEIARGLKMPITEFIETAIIRYAKAHDARLEYCEVVEDEPGQIDTLVGMRSKWSAN